MTEAQFRPASMAGDLRSEIAGRFAQVTAAAGVLLLWLTLVRWPFPLLMAGGGALLLAFSLGVRELARRRPAWGRHALTWGLTVLLLLALWSFWQSWLPLVGVLVILIATPLVRGGGAVVAALVIAVAAWLAAAGHRVYDIPLIASLLTASAGLSAIAYHSLFSALRWAEEAWQRADRLFDESSSRQIELNQTLKSLELANEPPAAHAVRVGAGAQTG